MRTHEARRWIITIYNQSLCSLLYGIYIIINVMKSYLSPIDAVTLHVNGQFQRAFSDVVRFQCLNPPVDLRYVDNFILNIQLRTPHT